ncbi:fmo1 Thiol-specific monooxygenase [Candida maltosa Xu316]
MTQDKPLYNRIAIIGGGPTGLAALKALALEPVKFQKIDLFERRDKLGGLWYHNGDKSLISPKVPSISPNAGENVSGKATKADEYFSSIYKYMETNISHQVMHFRDVHFPPESRKFPKRDQVLDYINSYVDSIPKDGVNIHLNSNIVSVEKINNVWKVQVEDTVSGQITTRDYDAIIVANGHFSVPYIPDVQGLASWNEHLPKTILHSKYYESPMDFKDKRVLIIGNNASGVDISVQLGVAAKEIIVSTKELDSPNLHRDVCKYIGVVEEYNWEDRSVRTNDEVVKDIDYVIFCTGFLHSIPFLKVDGIITNGFNVYQLYKQLFYVDDPSLSIIAILRNVVPMPLAETQGSWIARVYSGRYKLPSTKELRADYETELAEKGDDKLHDFDFPKDAEYIQSVQKLIDDQGLRSPGLVAPIWDEELCNLRGKFKNEKQARLRVLAEHVKKLRAEGKDFELLDY